MSESNDTGQGDTPDSVLCPWDLDGNRRDNPGEFLTVQGMRLTPLDAEGRPSGPSVPVEGAVHLHYTTLDADLDPAYTLFGPPDSPVRRRVVEVGEAAGPMLAQAGAVVGPMLATMADRLRPAFELLASRFAAMVEAVRPILEKLERMPDQGDTPVRLRDGRVVPLESVRPAALSRALTGKLRRHR
jgi:hypothetical protein